MTWHSPNLLAFSGYYELKMAGQFASLPTHVTDQLTHFALVVFAEGNFYSLFSLLFGIGFAVQMLRWTITDVAPSHFRLPAPVQLVLRPDEHWYRLRRREAAPAA